MTLLLAEGLDALADYTERFGNYSGPNVSLESVIVRNGSQSLQCDSDSSVVTLPVSSTPASVIVGFAFRFTESLSTYVNYLVSFLRFYTGTGSQAGWLANTAAGAIVYGRRSGVSSYPAMATSSDGVVTINTWHYIEVKFTISNSTAADDLIVKVDGVEVINIGAGQDTLYSGSLVAEIGFAAMYNDASVYYDDIYIIDEAGSVNNDFLGDVIVETLYPDGNGNYSQFLGSDADNTDNYLHVDEAQHDGDTSYIEESTAGERDSFTFDNLSVSPSSIKGISVCAVTKKDTSGSRTGKIFCRQGGSDYDGSEFTPGSDYTIQEEIFEEDPDTSSAWTESGVNSAEFGVKVES